MANMRDIRRRIKSVKSTQQITKAMKMVAAAKLRKSQAALEAMRPYADKNQEILGNLLGGHAEHHHPLLDERPQVNKVCYVLLAGDRGLCGGYNSSICRLAEETLKKETREAVLVTCGRRGRDMLMRAGFPILQSFTNLGDNPSFAQSVALYEYLVGLFLKGGVDEIYFIYQEFISAIQQKPIVRRIFPAAVDESHQRERLVDYLFEPNEGVILDTLLPQYLECIIYQAMLEAKAGEHGATMTAMSAATDNAAAMLERLTLSLNRARQAAITTEISEIVSGAAALQ
jgi:F-type H+-transporting ATPase subunit gamma